MYLMNGDKPIMQINDIQDGDLKYEYNTKYKYWNHYIKQYR